MSEAVARNILRKLSRHYGLDGIEEVVVNREGWVYRKFRGSDWEEVEDPEITYDYIANKVCRVLANINNARFSEDELPIVSCELPGLPFRFQAVVGPNVRYELTDRRGIAVAIRSLMANTEIQFKHYGLEPGAKLSGTLAKWFEMDLSDDAVEQLGQVIEMYQSVLVSGATSTGKTTFVNQVIQLIDRRKRVITVEDAREVTVPHRNRVHMMVPRNTGGNKIGYNQILDAIVRLTPEFVVCGELSVYNALPLFSLMGKGHPVLTTVHASSPEEAKMAFVNNMMSAGNVVPVEASIDQINSLIGCIVQLENRGGKRRVVDIQFPSRERRERIKEAAGARP